MMVPADVDSKTKTPENVETFTLFQLLPLELRHKIWALTFQPQVLEYRLITTHVPGITRSKFGDPRSYDHFNCNKAPPIPVALQVCHESRS
jgi:hypothetical protein